MPSSRSTWARAAISGTTPPKRACSSVCERTILDRILPLPSLWRSTTAAAVSSQVVSIPSTSIGVSLSNLSPCAIGQNNAFRNRVALRGHKVQSSGWAEIACRRRSEVWPFSSRARIRTMRRPPRRCARGVLRCCARRCCGSSRSPFQDDADARYGAVIVTSANALRAIAPHLAGSRLLKLPLFAVGEHTATAARDAGFGEVIAAKGDAGALARSGAGQRRSRSN